MSDKEFAVLLQMAGHGDYVLLGLNEQHLSKEEIDMVLNLLVQKQFLYEEDGKYRMDIVIHFLLDKLVAADTVIADSTKNMGFFFCGEDMVVGLYCDKRNSSIWHIFPYEDRQVFFLDERNQFPPGQEFMTWQKKQNTVLVSTWRRCQERMLGIG